MLGESNGKIILQSIAAKRTYSFRGIETWIREIEYGRCIYLDTHTDGGRECG